MDTPAWIWFAIAVVAFVAGAALLLVDRTRRVSSNRERRRWADLRGWQFAETDNVLPSRWEYGAIAYYGAGFARDVVAGSTFTSDGRRQVSVLDLDVGGRVQTTLAGVRCHRSVTSIIELWVPDVPVPKDSELDLLGPVGSRYAFVTDLTAARPLVTPDLVEALEEIGENVEVVWVENDWVMAAARPDIDPAGLERLLRGLGEMADVLDPVEDSAPHDTGGADEARGADEASGTDEDDLDVDILDEPAGSAADRDEERSNDAHHVEPTAAHEDASTEAGQARAT